MSLRYETSMVQFLVLELSSLVTTRVVKRASGSLERIQQWLAGHLSVNNGKKVTCVYPSLIGRSSECIQPLAQVLPNATFYRAFCPSRWFKSRLALAISGAKIIRFRMSGRGNGPSHILDLIHL